MANNYRNHQTDNYGRNYQRMTYIEGNTVRRADAMPDDWENEQKRRREREQRLNADNAATSMPLATAVKTDDVKAQAVDMLGMSYPSEDQIVYYEIDHADFMSQYGEIPE